MRLDQEADQIISSDLSKKEKIIQLCNLVREIPYARIGSLDPKDMVKVGKGSCTPKHIFLGRYLKKIGVPFKFLFIPFYYRKMDLDFPTDKKEIVENMPISYHLALKVKIGAAWRIVDVTWDSKLKGFPTTKDWYANSDMKLGVIPEEIIEIDRDPEEFEKKKVAKFTEDEKVARKLFYEFFDEFLEESRKLWCN